MNIEKTISEHAVSDILTPMLESQDRIVTEDVAPLFDQATGLDTPPASGSVTTTIEESRNLITAIIRKAWTATLTMLGGASVISYIAAAYTYLRTRLQGNETYGIPDRRSEISASSPLAANLALLNDRKIGGADTIDGVSLGRLLCDSSAAATITEITDDTTGWTMDKAPSNAFPNAKKVTLRCKTLHAAPSAMFPNAEEFNLPDLDHIDTSEAGHPQTDLFYGASIKKIAARGLKRFYVVNASYSGVFYNLTGHCEIDLSGCTYMDAREGGGYPVGFHTITGVWKIVLGTCTRCHVFTLATNAQNLIHFEIGQGTACSMNHGYWNPTNALDASRTDLIEEGSTAQNNLQQFLENFREYIAKKLANRTGLSKLTLTLSANVFSAVFTNESGSTEEIVARNAIRDEIRGEITDRNWKVTDSTNNFNN